MLAQLAEGKFEDWRAQAVKEGTDVVICDTSGRLHTNDNLMQELLKCKRALGAP